MDVKLLLALAHEQLIEKVRELDLVIVDYKENGFNRVPRRIHGTRQQTWTRRIELSTRDYKSAVEWRERYVKLLEELEPRLAEAHDKEDSEWAQAFAEHVRANRRTKK